MDDKPLHSTLLALTILILIITSVSLLLTAIQPRPAILEPQTLMTDTETSVANEEETETSSSLTHSDVQELARELGLITNWRVVADWLELENGNIWVRTTHLVSEQNPCLQNANNCPTENWIINPQTKKAFASTTHNNYLASIDVHAAPIDEGRLLLNWNISIDSAGRAGLDLDRSEVIRTTDGALMFTTIPTRAGVIFDIPSKWEFLYTQFVPKTTEKTITKEYVNILTSEKNPRIVATIIISAETFNEKTWDLLESTDTLTLYREACAPGTCFRVGMNGTYFAIDWMPVDSDEPVPENLDGVWFPTPNFDYDDMVAVTRTFRFAK